MDNASLRILLVDDFEIVRVMIRDGLQDLGFTLIDEAEDGREALTMINKSVADGTPYDLIFCDWVMPHVQGIEVLETCKANEATKQIPFVMVTAESERAAIVRAMRSGALDYIVKPISPPELAKKVTALVQKIKGAQS